MGVTDTLFKKDFYISLNSPHHVPSRSFPGKQTKNPETPLAVKKCENILYWAITPPPPMRILFTYALK